MLISTTNAWRTHWPKVNNTQFFKKPVFLFSLLLTAVGLYAISLPEILFGWDERFHALVALNLTHDIFPPTLYPEKVVDHYDYDPWYRTHIWLHKPPLFTYQIALFFKLFGSSTLNLKSLCFAYAERPFSCFKHVIISMLNIFGFSIYDFRTLDFWLCTSVLGKRKTLVFAS